VNLQLLALSLLIPAALPQARKQSAFTATTEHYSASMNDFDHDSRQTRP